MGISISDFTPTRGHLLLEIFDKDMTIHGFERAGDTETSEVAVVVKKGIEGSIPMPYAPGDRVIIGKFHGKRYEEDGRVFIPVNASQVLMYGK